MDKSRLHDEMICRIAACLSPVSGFLQIENKGCGLIQVYSSIEDRRKGLPYKIAHADIVLLDESNEPILVIEPETSSSPKTFGRSIPVYSMAGEIRFNNRKYPISRPLLLMIVVPDHKSDIARKRSQLEDIQNRANRLIAARESKLKDVSICQIADFEIKIKELLENNGYSSIARRLNKNA